MRLKSMIVKTLIASILSSLITLTARLVLDMLASNSPDTARNAAMILLSLLAPVSFSVILIYLLHVYRGNGEGEVWEDYPETYGGIIRDISMVVKKECPVLALIASVGALNLTLWLLNHLLIHSRLIKIITDIFISVSSLGIIFRDDILQKTLGYLSGTLFTCAVYVIVYALFRWKWRKFM